MAFTLRVQNFRGLRRVEWSPSGVCALVGPNGSGKTTLIDVLSLLRDAALGGFSRAMEEHGGAYGLRHFAAPKDEPVALEVQLEDASWKVQPQLSPSPGGIRLPVLDELTWGGVEIHKEQQADGMLSPMRLREILTTSQFRPPLPEPEPVEHLAELVRNYSHYRYYTLQGLRREGSRLGGDLRLFENGRNLFAVLMNWRNRRDQLPRWKFVTEGLQACFPNLFADFSFPVVTNIVSCEVHTPSDDTLTPTLLPDGFLVALLHLCAVASAEPGGVIAIDEPENALHPYAIRHLMEAFRSWSDEHDVTVLLATHSPVLLDTFKEQPDKVFVLEPGHEVLPVPLDQLKKRNWLAHFALGDLYKHLEYGAPAGVEEK